MRRLLRSDPFRQLDARTVLDRSQLLTPGTGWRLQLSVRGHVEDLRHIVPIAAE